MQGSRTRELVFLGPGLCKPPPSAGVRHVQLLGMLTDMPFSTDDDHRVVTERLTEVYAQAEAVALAVEPEVNRLVGSADGFWQEYYPSLVFNVAGPFLANSFIAQAALEECQPDIVRVRENIRRRGWVLGREVVTYPVCAAARATGTTVLTSPGWSALLGLRRLAERVVVRGHRHRELRQCIREASGRPPDPQLQPADVLFVPTSATQVPYVSCLTKDLSASHGLAHAVVNGSGWPLTSAALQRSNLAFCRWEHLLSNEDIVAARRMLCRGREFAATLTMPQISHLLPENIAAGLSEVMREHICTALVAEWPLFHLRRVAARRILDRVQPRCVVAFDNTYNACVAPCVRLANDRGIPTLEVQHGALGGLGSLVQGTLAYTHLAVFGEFACEWMRRIHRPETQFTITGNCMYDRFAASLPAVAPSVAAGAGLGVTPAKPIILVAGQPDDAIPRNVAGWWMAEICDTASALGAEVQVKLHPGDTRAKAWRRGLRPWPHAQVIIHGETPLVELIRRCDVLVTRYSAVVFDAALLGKPAMTVNLTGRKDPYPFAEEGGAFGVYRLEDIRPVLEGILSRRLQVDPERRQRFLHRHCGPLDGRAAERMGNVIASYARPAGNG